MTAVQFNGEEAVDALTLSTLAALVWKTVDLFKYAVNGKLDPVLTQAIIWVAGIAVAFLAGPLTSPRASRSGGSTLGDLDSLSKVLLGLTLSSFGGVGHDLKKLD